jgi:PTH1 family peptidyl-tRNA hydrolase
MMIILYGLGNNASKYLNTKHNLGRLILENLAKKYQLEFKNGGQYYYVKTSVENEELYFVYSAGFMNESGEPLYKFINYFKLQPQESDLIIILHDDSDQIEQKVKFLPQGGAAGHNGIVSVYKHLPATGFEINQLWRLKIGIRPAENKLKSETFVLTKLSKNDEQSIESISQKTHKNIDLLIKRELAKFQTRLH